jgi:hypothetical protein
MTFVYTGVDARELGVTPIGRAASERTAVAEKGDAIMKSPGSSIAWF